MHRLIRNAFVLTPLGLSSALLGLTGLPAGAATLGETFERVRPSVVVIHTVEREGPTLSRAREVALPGLGSGVVISADGQVLTAAGLHHEFADVLTYLYDSEHANHIHVDTGRFGAERPRLIRRSRVQVQAVQAMCRHVWGRTDVEITGEWDDRTRDVTTQILEGVGANAELSESQQAWQAFMVATMQHG